jgi:mannose-6-phosphate isomerase-like protein (cupin superfamily)
MIFYYRTTLTYRKFTERRYNMSGLYFGKNDSYIERVSKQGEELSLLAKGDGIEVMTQKIKSDIVFWIDPGEDSSIMEFFYIISGAVLCKNEDTNTELNAGEYFFVQNLKIYSFQDTVRGNDALCCKSAGISPSK